jgi:ATP-dependent Clp endopeptidase proteolytic subunit ClpP
VAGPAPSVVSIYDEVGFFGVTAQDFIREVNVIDGDLELHLSTPGGDVFDGLAIFSALKQRSGIVSVVVDSLAASMGSVIAMAASPGQLSIMPNASMMVHDPSGYCEGTRRDMAEMARLLDSMGDNIAGIYADRTGKSVDHWRAAMLAETWYLGRAAVDAGLADRVVSAPSRATNLAWGPAETAAMRAALGL